MGASGTGVLTGVTIRDFRIAIPQSDLDDLHDRLVRTRLPRPAPGDDGDTGTPNHWLTTAVEHWRTAFDWRALEERLNAFPQFVTEIDGQELHFLHVASPVPGATPLLLLHSYPGSVADFLDMIGPLTDPAAHGGDPADAFSVVVPSLPGFGFSAPLTERGWTTPRIARAMDELMRLLGYDSYGAHGSDIGANVAREIGLLDPPGFLGLHVLQLFAFPSGDPAEFEALTPEDYAGLEHMQWFQSVGGYSAMNASRPQTVAVGLADSPVAQLAYSELLDSFGNGTSLLTLDQILGQVSLYWLTNTAASAARLYLEDARAGGEPRVSPARTGVAVFADDFRTVAVFAERDNSQVVHWSHFDKGGHYAAMERPDDVAADLRRFFA
jgi:pimeloyl-ACP methyl ester carboxylesterase